MVLFRHYFNRDHFRGGGKVNIKTAVMAVLVSAVGFGCMGTQVHFSDAPMEKLDLSRGRTVKARASGLHLFGLIPLGINNRQVRAYEKLKAEAGEDYLTDITIRDGWKWVVIGNKYVTVLTAVAYPDKTKRPAAIATQRTLSEKMDELKKLSESGAITELEYKKARQRLLNEF